MDPWKECERIYDNHFMDRMRGRFLDKNQAIAALREGSKEEEKKNEFKIRWKTWILKVSLGDCFIYMRTAHHK